MGEEILVGQATNKGGEAIIMGEEILVGQAT
ncbi:MAG: hypothetical protein RIR48_1837, partial [Bacteroidota bacterium]